METVITAFSFTVSALIIIIGILLIIIRNLKRIISAHLDEKREIRTELERSLVTKAAIIRYRDELIVDNQHLNNNLKQTSSELESLTNRYKAIKADFGALLTDIAVDMCKAEVNKNKTKAYKVVKDTKAKGKGTRKGKSEPPSTEGL